MGISLLSSDTDLYYLALYDTKGQQGVNVGGPTLRSGILAFALCRSLLFSGK
jgi:hypothetical protein